MAWNAAMSIQPGELEALELAFGHDMDLSLVLGLPPADAEELLDRAKQNLERSLGAEVLIRRNYDCPARAEVMSGWTGMMTAAIRDRVLEHAGACPDCGPNLPRNVSAARVFTLLPAPAFSTVARLEVLKFIADPRLSAYREFVTGRASEFNAAGFPVMPAATVAEVPAAPDFDVFAVAPKPAPVRETAPSEHPTAHQGPGRPAGTGRRNAPSARRRRMPGRRAIVAGACALGVTTLFAVLGFSGIPTAMRASGPTIAPPAPSASASAPLGGGADITVPVKVRRPASVRSSPPPVPRSTTRTEALAVAATLPVTSSQAPVLPSAIAPPPSTATLTAAPDSLTLGSSSTGTITLTAAGGAVRWSASASSTQASLSSGHGTLKAGQSTTITVSVRGSSGSAVISIAAAPGGTSPASSGSSAVMTVSVAWGSASASGSGSGSGTGSGLGSGTGSGPGPAIGRGGPGARRRPAPAVQPGAQLPGVTERDALGHG